MASPGSSTLSRIFRLSHGSHSPDSSSAPSGPRKSCSSIDASVPRNHRQILRSLNSPARSSSLDSQTHPKDPPVRRSSDFPFPLSIPAALYASHRRVHKGADTSPAPSPLKAFGSHKLSRRRKPKTTPPGHQSTSSQSSTTEDSTTSTSILSSTTEPTTTATPSATPVSASADLPRFNGPSFSLGTVQPPPAATSIGQLATYGSVGDVLTFRARLSHQRPVSAHLTFLLLRDGLSSIQAVVRNAPVDVVRWVQRLRDESIVSVTGTLVLPPAPVRSATVKALELVVDALALVAPVGRPLAVDNYHAPDSLRARMADRVVDLRHPANAALFRVRAMVLRKFRESLDDMGFIEINTPKLQPAATESGAEVFKVNYFGRRAFLAQSPQLAKQMAIAADFKRVYEIGPVFRAENSNTHRHLTEYIGLDIEMELQNDHYELLSVVDTTLKNIIRAVQQMPELAVVRQRWPSSDLVILDKTPIIPFVEGIEMLRADGNTEIEVADLSTRDEIRLGELVRQKYGTDYYILDKFPSSARPFYAQRIGDSAFTNGFDIFLRGQEISSGGQRIHDAAVLRRSLRNSGIADAGMEEYIGAFDAGAPPHGGAGFGLERILMLLLQLGDVRYASLFYRDPKSLPEKPVGLAHPHADTTKPGRMPPLEDLIANYGDSSNTAWLDDRFEVWRHTATGAAVGFVRQGKLAIITGNPLCDASQYGDVIHAFLAFLGGERLTPVWMLVSSAVEHILAHLSWRTLSCTTEQRVDTTATAPGTERHERRAARHGVSVREVRPDADLRTRIDVQIGRWRASRSGRQVHLTSVRPWIDEGHRRYFVAEAGGEVCGLVVLTQLARQHGWQIKWALDFPGAPGGSIEVLIGRALAAAGGPATFGAGPARRLTAGANMSGAKATILAKTYAGLMEGLSLGKKSDFRAKFGIKDEALWICYPAHGVGVMDLKNLMKFFEHGE
ncbi:hypothetical protein TD95_001258 [Thielaviopsis punctulata]|uniref:Probable aspartate--tRNA ligase, cytoplasmic n=1 Tax=Thielaviopsis punctulata TaxID=72032 RepID=A0A0F4ZC01_9PEZI|nr:hypothetical protein TD95_001258 [Thielaviopsis punctulata]